MGSNPSRRNVDSRRLAPHTDLIRARRRPARQGGDERWRRSPRAQSKGESKRFLRSRLWFDNPENPGMTALYLERYLNFGLDARRAPLGQADHRHRPDRLRSFALQPPSSRARQARARRDHGGRRSGVRVSGPPHTGDGQAADRGARPQSRLSRPRRGADGLFSRRRRADDRLRQDHSGLHHGGGDGQHSRDRALGRPDEQRLASRRAQPARARSSGSARSGSRRRQDRL